MNGLASLGGTLAILSQVQTKNKHTNDTYPLTFKFIQINSHIFILMKIQVKDWPVPTWLLVKRKV